jgi:hypothetical protein
MLNIPFERLMIALSLPFFLRAISQRHLSPLPNAENSDEISKVEFNSKRWRQTRRRLARKG